MPKLAELQVEELFGPGHRMCAGCGGAVTARMVLKALKRPAYVVQSTGCMEVATTIYPYTAWKVPWVHGLFENASAIACGIETYLKSRENGEKKNFDIVVLSGDGGTFDIGLQALSGAFERRHDFTYICYDNEAYMNCLPGDTLVMTQNGAKRVDEVQVGEGVYTYDRGTSELTIRRCSGVFDNGIRPVHEISTLHHLIRSTPNHPYLVVSRRGRGRSREFKWKPLSELRPGEEIVVMKKLDEEASLKFNFTLTTKSDYKVHKLNEIRIPQQSSQELLEYLGLFVGDGWTRAQKGETGFAIPEGATRRRLLQLYKKLFGPNGIGKFEDYYVYFNSVNLARFIDSLGFGKGAKNKAIPAWVFTLPNEEKEAFVKGLLDSDGYRYGNSYRYVSSSSELLRTLRLLLQTMNYRVGKIIWQTAKKGKEFPHRKLLKDTRYGSLCFSKKRKWNLEKYPNQYRYQDPLIESENFAVESVKHVEYIGQMRTFDLRVEKDHNFIAEGVVVHNTGIQRSSATPEGAWTTTTPVGKFSPGKVGPKKDLVAFALAHRVDYAATACPTYWSDFITKVQKAADVEGPALIHALAPCPLGWRFKTEETIQMGRLAVQSRYFPLYEVERGKYKLSMNPHQTPLEDFLRVQGRFSHLFNPEYAGELVALKTQVEQRWLALQELCQGRHPTW
jgi:pyruvate/2-oxoacid:ferredoxin oxidoreductase beta subunit/intein/homing endonuclease